MEPVTLSPPAVSEVWWRACRKGSSTLHGCGSWCVSGSGSSRCLSSCRARPYRSALGTHHWHLSPTMAPVRAARHVDPLGCVLVRDDRGLRIRVAGWRDDLRCDAVRAGNHGWLTSRIACERVSRNDESRPDWPAFTRDRVEPTLGFEPRTCCLRNRWISSSPASSDPGLLRRLRGDLVLEPPC
jgi:hypothetical protein